MIEIECPVLGGRHRLHGQIELPKQPPMVIDVRPAARLWFKVPEVSDVWRRCRLLFWHPGEGRVPEAFEARVREDGGPRIVARWQVMGLDEHCRTRNGIDVGDWSPTVLLETPFYVRTDQ